MSEPTYKCKVCKDTGKVGRKWRVRGRQRRGPNAGKLYSTVQRTCKECEIGKKIREEQKTMYEIEKLRAKIRARGAKLMQKIPGGTGQVVAIGPESNTGPEGCPWEKGPAEGGITERFRYVMKIMDITAVLQNIQWALTEEGVEKNGHLPEFTEERVRFEILIDLEARQITGTVEWRPGFTTVRD